MAGLLLTDSNAPRPQLNIANPATGTQKKVEIDNNDKLCAPSTARLGCNYGCLRAAPQAARHRGRAAAVLLLLVETAANARRSRRSDGTSLPAGWPRAAARSSTSALLRMLRVTRSARSVPRRVAPRSRLAPRFGGGIERRRSTLGERGARYGRSRLRVQPAWWRRRFAARVAAMGSMLIRQDPSPRLRSSRVTSLRSWEARTRRALP